PQEFTKLRQMIDIRDRRIWDIAQGKSLPAEIDDSNTLELQPIETNFNQPIKYFSPDDALETFTIAEGYQVNLFASEVEFPDLKEPVAMNFYARCRLWVATSPSYPQYLPGIPPNDKLLILEDTDG